MKLTPLFIVQPPRCNFSPYLVSRNQVRLDQGRQRRSAREVRRSSWDRRDTRGCFGRGVPVAQAHGSSSGTQPVRPLPGGSPPQRQSRPWLKASPLGSRATFRTTEELA
jgi:hypothetical protein